MLFLCVCVCVFVCVCVCVCVRACVCGFCLLVPTNLEPPFLVQVREKMLDVNMEGSFFYMPRSLTSGLGSACCSAERTASSSDVFSPGEKPNRH